MSNLKDLKKIKSFEIDDFDGVNTTIEDVVLLDVDTKDFGDGLKEVRQLKIITSNLAKKGEEEFRASEYVSLKYDQKTKAWGYSENPKSKATKILNFFGVKDFEELIGKKCRVVKRMNGDKFFLGIHHG